MSFDHHPPIRPPGSFNLFMEDMQSSSWIWSQKWGAETTRNGSVCPGAPPITVCLSLRPSYDHPADSSVRVDSSFSFHHPCQRPMEGGGERLSLIGDTSMAAVEHKCLSMNTMLLKLRNFPATRIFSSLPHNWISQQGGRGRGCRGGGGLFAKETLCYRVLMVSVVVVQCALGFSVTMTMTMGRRSWRRLEDENVPPRNIRQRGTGWLAWLVGWLARGNVHLIWRNLNLCELNKNCLINRKLSAGRASQMDF